jgi:hypothetical protein
MKFQLGPTAGGPTLIELRMKAGDRIIGSKASLDNFLCGPIDLGVVHCNEEQITASGRVRGQRKSSGRP